MHCARSRRVVTLLLRATCKGLMEFGSIIIIIIISSSSSSIASASHQHHHIPLLTNKVTGDTRKNTPFLTIIMGSAISWSWDFYSTFLRFSPFSQPGLPRAFPGPSPGLSPGVHPGCLRRRLLAGEPQQRGACRHGPLRSGAHLPARIVAGPGLGRWGFHPRITYSWWFQTWLLFSIIYIYNIYYIYIYMIIPID